MNEEKIIQWYPGHMAKTRRLIDENLKLVDIVVELIDARIPYSGRNSEFDNILKQKPRLLVMTKADLADKNVTERWIKYYKQNGQNIISVNSLSGKGVNNILSEASNILRDKIEKNAQKGINKTIKMMIVGIPNVGKSSLINSLIGKSSTKTGDRPGVTKGKQWVRVRNGIELLDTPGILAPKFENQNIGRNLAYIGSIRDEIIDVQTLAANLLELLSKKYPQCVMQRYKLTDSIEGVGGFEIMERIGKKRGFIVSGGEIDYERCANIVLDEFRSAKTGLISLETPEDIATYTD